MDIVLIIGALRLGTHVVRGKEERPRNLGVWKCGGLGLEKIL